MSTDNVNYLIPGNDILLDSTNWNGRYLLHRRTIVVALIDFSVFYHSDQKRGFVANETNALV